MEQGDLFFSIILPVYNAKRYLSSCIDSIISQSYMNWELLCVDDGSFDGSSDILNRYCSLKPRRIKVIYKKNEGVAVARNVALNRARGEYILFCDADDVMFPGTLQQIANALQQNPVDYLRFEYKTIDEAGRDLYPNYEAKQRRKLCGELVDAATCVEKIIRKEFFLWSGVFRCSIIKEHGIEFLEGCTYNEDTLFIVNYLRFCETCLYVPFICYGYRKYGNAVTARFTERNFADVFNVFMSLNALADETGEKKLAASVRNVAQASALAIYRYLPLYGNQEHKEEIWRQCVSRPQLLEWKLIALFGEKAGSFLMKIAETTKRAVRKLGYWL